MAFDGRAMAALTLVHLAASRTRTAQV